MSAIRLEEDPNGIITVGRETVGLAPAVLPPEQVRRAIWPLKLLIAGGILYLVQMGLYVVNPAYWICADTLGLGLIACALVLLADIPVRGHYRLMIRAALAATLVSIVRSGFMPVQQDWPPWLSAILPFEMLAEIVAVVIFCLAMRRFCQEGNLLRAWRSWKFSAIFFTVFYLVPMGVVHFSSIVALRLGGSGITISSWWLWVTFAAAMFVPLLQVLISVWRTGREAAAMPDATFESYQPAVVKRSPQIATWSIVALAVIAALAAPKLLDWAYPVASPSGVRIEGFKYWRDSDVIGGAIGRSATQEMAEFGNTISVASNRWHEPLVVLIKYHERPGPVANRDGSYRFHGALKSEVRFDYHRVSSAGDWQADLVIDGKPWLRTKPLTVIYISNVCSAIEVEIKEAERAKFLKDIEALTCNYFCAKWIAPRLPPLPLPPLSLTESAAQPQE